MSSRTFSASLLEHRFNRAGPANLTLHKPSRRKGGSAVRGRDWDVSGIPGCCFGEMLSNHCRGHPSRSGFSKKKRDTAPTDMAGIFHWEGSKAREEKQLRRLGCLCPTLCVKKAASSLEARGKKMESCLGELQVGRRGQNARQKLDRKRKDYCTRQELRVL